METYLDMMVAFIFNWEADPDIKYSRKAGNVLSFGFMVYCFLVTLVVIPVMVLYVLCSPLEKI